MKTTRQLCISGRVQGVGYRDALRRQALACGLAGWVRNRHDGTVEALLQGDAGRVEELIAWARRGPPAARVDRVDVQPAQAESDRPFAGFEMLPTA
ncbi:Acylphosphatase [compost metagenome]